MRRSSVYKFFAPIVLVIALAHPALAQQSSANFAKAIANGSTSPSYVLITVINDNTRSRQTVCTAAPFLLGAIHFQYNLPYTDVGIQKGKRVALASKDRVYHFSDLKALKNLRVRYTQQELTVVRSQLHDFSTEEIVAGFSDSSDGLHELYRKQKSFLQLATYRDALSHILLERGLQPRMADMTGGLYLEK